MSNLQKTSAIVLYILFIISVILAGWFYFGGDVPTANPNYPEPKATGVFLTWGVILFGIATVLALLFSLVNIISNPKSIKNAIVVIALAGVLLLISYLMASTKSIPDLTVPTTESTLKWVGTGLYATYILGGVAFLGIIFSEIYRATR